MSPAYETYLKQVKQGLCCLRAEQKRLVAALEQEILDAFPNAAELSLAQLEEHFGPPERMAQELQQALPENAAADTAKRRLRSMCMLFLLGILTIALIAGGLIYREHQKALNAPREVVVVTPPPEVVVVPRQSPVAEMPPAEAPPVEAPPESFPSE